MTIPLDAPVRPVQCPQCLAWCLLGQCNGFKVAVTASPISVEGFRAALMAGLGVYGLTSTRKLKLIVPGSWKWPQRFLAHPCVSWADVPLKTPQKAAQGVCRVRPGLGCADVAGVSSCIRCEPPPFDQEKLAHGLIVGMLGGKVVDE